MISSEAEHRSGEVRRAGKDQIARVHGHAENTNAGLSEELIRMSAADRRRR